MNKMLSRVAVTAVVAPTVALAAPAAAMADTLFGAEASAAGPQGAVSQEVLAFAGDGFGHGKDGKGKDDKGKGGHGGFGGVTLYKESFEAAGPYGAISENLVSVAD
ncbi:hypothetical protein ACQEU5_02240 [Marinactinospora thermotolerans]|uniref:Uncharacterized protein n=1 Tax=Marinactinospora thermotolerans DSM 45154 TaxID=1122192 RepID=A0A1T4LXP6_9ACTN|nr:hypothetical protein [Marinactinospora thermotolerans]SJZ59452.1 hypothetical protein SAMN02745673_00860 [Marinactinospora thermotolerans DSM 45154]